MYVAVLDTKNGRIYVRAWLPEWNGQTNNKMCFWFYVVFFQKKSIYLSIYLTYKQYVVASFAEYLVKKMSPRSIHLADSNNKKFNDKSMKQKVHSI